MTRRSITLVFVLSFVLTSPVAHAATESVGGRASIATGALYPDVSPDGKSLAVSYQGSIATLPAKGGTMRIVSKGQAWNVWPRWSPDGKRIAYVSAPNFGPGVVKLLNMETGKEIKLPKSVWSAGAFWFHPDGKRLFGRFAFRGMPQKLSFVDLGTGEITMVNGSLYGFGTRRAAYTLSPDGNWIYFGVQYDHPGQQGGNNGPQTDVHRISSEGGKPEKLFQWPARIYHMCVAADGKSLFAMTDRGTAHNDIWQLPLDNPLANARKLSFGIADDDWPVTSPEGKHVYFTDNREGATAITAHTLASGESQDIRITAIDHRAPLKRMVLKLDAPDSNQGEAWRVSIRRKSGGFHFPPGAMYHITAGLGHFYHRGDLQMELPVGAYEIRVFRGPEFRADLTSINLTEGSGEQVFHPTVTRWTDMRAKGWYSGENHIHANYGYGQWYNTPRSILDMCEAEDLHVANLVVANSDGDAIFDREFFHGGPDPLSTANTLLWWNEEFRSTIWGHMTLFHLRHLVEPIMTGFRKTTNPWDVPTNGEILRRTRRQGAAAGYTHPSNNAEDPYDQPYSAKGLPVDAALGLVDCADVMGNVYPKVIPFWYRLLNAGFRLPASAGTDCFLNRVSMGPPGWGRVREDRRRIHLCEVGGRPETRALLCQQRAHAQVHCKWGSATRRHDFNGGSRIDQDPRKRDGSLSARTTGSRLQWQSHCRRQTRRIIRHRRDFRFDQDHGKRVAGSPRIRQTHPILVGARARSPHQSHLREGQGPPSTGPGKRRVFYELDRTPGARSGKKKPNSVPERI